METGKCVFDDIVNQIAIKLEEADGLVLASPVYYASANGTLISLLDRLFYSSHFDKTMKVGASVAVARRGGCSSTFDELNKYFTDAPVYDPYAVALALRLRVEKVMYDKLGSEQLKNDFVETHKTNEKLKFCEDNNIPVPDAYFIVNAIHN